MPMEPKETIIISVLFISEYLIEVRGNLDIYFLLIFDEFKSKYVKG